MVFTKHLSISEDDINYAYTWANLTIVILNVCKVWKLITDTYFYTVIITCKTHVIVLIYTVTVNSSGGYIVCLSLLCFYISYCISCDCIMHSSPSYTVGDILYAILKKNVELDCYQIKENKTTIEAIFYISDVADWSSAMNIKLCSLCRFESKLVHTHTHTHTHAHAHEHRF